MSSVTSTKRTTIPRSCSSSSHGETFASWSSFVTSTSSPASSVRAKARVRRKLRPVMLGPKATSRASQRRKSAARCLACSIRSTVRREVSNEPPTFALSSRRYAATASITSSGHCVPPGPSKNASGRCSAVNRARTASMSSASVVLMIFQRHEGGSVPAHAVDATTGRRRGGADVETFQRRAVRDELSHGPEEELTEIHRPAVDVPADDVPVASLEIRRSHRVSSEDEVAEARCEALDLPLDAVGDVLVRAERDVAVRPRRVLSGGSARVVEERRLCEEDERVLVAGGALGRGDLLQRPADVHRRCALAIGRRPGDRPVQSPVE